MEADIELQILWWLLNLLN